MTVDACPLGLAQEAFVMGERAIIALCFLLRLAHFWARLAADPQCLLAVVGSWLCACDSGESQGCRLQPGSSLLQFSLHSPFLLFGASSPILWGPINVPLGFLKRPLSSL